MSAPVDGFASPESFDSTITFGEFFRRFLPMLIMTDLLVVVVGLLLNGMGLGVVGWVVVLVLGTTLTVGAVASKKRQFDETWGSTRLELSPAGATMVNRYVRVDLPWARIRHLGTAHLIVTRESGTSLGLGGVGGPAGRGSLIGAVLALLFARVARGVRQPALVGLGATATLVPDMPRLVRGQLAQNDSCRDFDPVTRRRMTAIVLTVYGRDWRAGRIGAWIGAYRPDLLATGPKSLDVPR